VLRRHRFTAAFFVMTVVLDKPGWLTRDEVRALDRAGMTIGAHTWDHRPMGEYGERDWRVQLDAPRADLETLVGFAIVGHSRGGHFARALAARRPELVSHTVSLGADLQAMFHCSALTLAAVEGARRVAWRTGRARREQCLTYRCDCTFTAGFPGAVPAGPGASDERLLQG
jgi:pimeloyl-ACP methyl ester carboxylesterase